MGTKVLILDDNENLHKLWREYLASCKIPCADLIDIISAFSVDEATVLFRANSDLAVIVVSGCITGREPSTVPFVKEVRKTSNVPIIATSLWSQDELEKAGCDHKSSKDYLPRKILEVLGLRKPPS